MKIYLLVFVILLVAAVSCKKQTSSTPLLVNATESKMIGKWYLQKEICVNVVLGASWEPPRDTTYTGYNSNAYITFESTKYDTTPINSFSNKKNCSFTWSPYYITPLDAFAETQSYWYYNESTKCLGFHSNFMGGSWSECHTLLTVNDHELIIKRGDNTSSVTSYFQK